MKTGIEAGMTATRRITIDKPRTIDFLGEDLRIYATPELVRDIEVTCRDFLLDYCDAGEDSLGTGVRVSHSGATLLGMNVEITIKVTKVDGRAVSFEAIASDGVEQIGSGEHSRFVVDVAKIKSKVMAKAQKVRGG